MVELKAIETKYNGYFMIIIDNEMVDSKIYNSNWYFTPDGEWDGLMCWGYCSEKGRYGIGMYGQTICSPDHISPECDKCHADAKYLFLLGAYEAAKSARF